METDKHAIIVGVAIVLLAAAIIGFWGWVRTHLRSLGRFLEQAVRRENRATDLNRKFRFLNSREVPGFWPKGPRSLSSSQRLHFRPQSLFVQNSSPPSAPAFTETEARILVIFAQADGAFARALFQRPQEMGLSVWTDAYSGEEFGVVTGPSYLPEIVSIRSIADTKSEFLAHGEVKSETPDSEPAGARARGLLQRRHVSPAQIVPIGKSRTAWKKSQRDYMAIGARFWRTTIVEIAGRRVTSECSSCDGNRHCVGQERQNRARVAAKGEAETR